MRLGLIMSVVGPVLYITRQGLTESVRGARRLCGGGKREEVRGRTRARLPVRQGWRRLASPRWFCAEAKDAHVVHLGHALPAGPANCGSGVTGLTTGGGWASEGRGRLNATGSPHGGSDVVLSLTRGSFLLTFRKAERMQPHPIRQIQCNQLERQSECNPRLAAGLHSLCLLTR